MLVFWSNVKKELDYKLLSQKELSAHTAISYNTLQSWITKDRLPDAEQALRIAQKLNTNIEYLVTGKNIAQKGINPHVQDLIPKLNYLSDENLDLLGLIAGRLR